MAELCPFKKFTLNALPLVPKNVTVLDIIVLKGLLQ